MPSRPPVNTAKPTRRRPSVSLLVSLHVNRGASPQISILSIAAPPLVCAILSIAADWARIRSESEAACWRTMQHKLPWVEKARSIFRLLHVVISGNWVMYTNTNAFGVWRLLSIRISRTINHFVVNVFWQDYFTADSYEMKPAHSATTKSACTYVVQSSSRELPIQYTYIRPTSILNFGYYTSRVGKAKDHLHG